MGAKQPEVLCCPTLEMNLILKKNNVLNISKVTISKFFFIISKFVFFEVSLEFAFQSKSYQNSLKAGKIYHKKLKNPSSA